MKKLIDDGKSVASSSAGTEALRLAVVGTGALGSALLRHLAFDGFQTVLLIDPDAVEPRNLPLSPFLQEALTRQMTNEQPMPHYPVPGNKASLLAAHARAGYGLQWHALPCEIADVGWQWLSAIDLLCCCTDSALSRAELAFIARMLRKPVLDGAVFGDGIAEGRVSRFLPAADAACYLCGLREDRRAAVLGYAGSAALGCQVPEAAPAMTGTVATLQQTAKVMLDAVRDFGKTATLGDHSFATRLVAQAGPAHDAALPAHGVHGVEQPLWLDGAAWRQRQLMLTRSEGCPWHDEPATLVALPWQQPLTVSLAAFPGQALQLDWPVCVEASCSACGSRCTPFLRVATVRHRLPCPRCGALGLQPMRGVHRIGPGHPLARRSPQQLGQPRHHLYCLGPAAV